MTVPGVKYPVSLLRQSPENPSTNRQNGCVGIYPQERVPLRTKNGPERNTSFRLIAYQFFFEERPPNIETVLVAPLINEQLLVRNAVTNIAVHVEKAVNKFELEKLTANQKGVDNSLSAGFDMYSSAL